MQLKKQILVQICSVRKKCFDMKSKKLLSDFSDEINNTNIFSRPGNDLSKRMLFKLKLLFLMTAKFGAKS